MHRLGLTPESPDWYRVVGEWRYTTSADVARAERMARNIDDSAAREWMQKRARLNLPHPMLQIRRPPE